MRRLACHLTVALLGLFLAQGAWADEYRLMTGDFIDGTPINFNESGVIFRQNPDGRLSLRTSWTNFTQESLQKLATMPQAKAFVEPFLIVEESEEEQAAAKEKLKIEPKPVPRLPAPDPKAGFGALFASPLSIVLFALIYLANVYAGYEIALFRNYPPLLVGASALLFPVVGPVLFLSLPTRIPVAEEEYYDVPPEELAGAEGQEAQPAAPPEEAAAKAQAKPQQTVYLRGQTTFNRRFFETKLAGFIRVVPGEDEKDMVLCVKSTRGDYVGTRLSRVLPNEIHLLVTKGGASADVTIPFTDIKEIVVRHKDA